MRVLYGRIDCKNQNSSVCKICVVWLKEKINFESKDTLWRKKEEMKRERQRGLFWKSAFASH